MTGQLSAIVITHKPYSRESGKWTFVRLGFKREGCAMVAIRILKMTTGDEERRAGKKERERERRVSEREAGREEKRKSDKVEPGKCKKK